MTEQQIINELVLVMALNVLTACAAANGNPLDPRLTTARSLACALDRGDHWGRIEPRLREEIEALRVEAGASMARMG